MNSIIVENWFANYLVYAVICYFPAAAIFDALTAAGYES
jgi:hypothetical protein